MTQLPKGKTRLDLIREGLVGGFQKRGRLVVGLDKLVEDPRNERRTFREMDALIASIKSVGLVEPITVAPLEGESGRYLIVTGHRRFRAARAAGLIQVEVLIRDPDDERTRRLKSIVSNVQREDVGAIELAEALQGLLDDRAFKSQRDLANGIGKPEAWVSTMLRILSLPVTLREKLSSTKVAIGYDAAGDIARLNREEDQAELVDALIAGASQDDIRARIRVKKGLPPVQRKTVDAPSLSIRVDPPKPKRVYHTKHKAVVIIQSETHRLTGDQVIEALQEALGHAASGSASATH
ncbi:MAG: ParB/RepB/Spo0J family partition protein [Tepidisphaeraceae bacterium]